MKASDLNPYIRYARIHKAHLHTKKSVSKCYDCRIFYFENTPGNVIVNGKKYNILNNTTAFFPPETEYKFNIDFSDGGKVFVIDFDLVNDYEDVKFPLGTATKDNYDPDLSPTYNQFEDLSSPIIRQIPQINTLLTQCTDSFILKDTLYREKSSAILKLCLLELIRQNSKNTHSKLCEDVLSYIHQNYTLTTLTNEDIATKFNYHPYHLSRMIKQETGKTLHKYLIYYRLQIAKDFLLTTQYDISEIAWRSGFCSAAYFIKIFRENICITPKEYRQTKMQMHTEI